LFDAIDRLRSPDARRFEYRGHYIDDVMELRPNPTWVVNMSRPRDRQALPGAAKMRRHLFGPLERSVERPRPSDRLVGVCLRASPAIIKLELIGDGNIQDAVVRRPVIGRADGCPFWTAAVVTIDIDDQRVV
jgi:hypothetical protein